VDATTYTLTIDRPVSDVRLCCLATTLGGSTTINKATGLPNAQKGSGQAGEAGEVFTLMNTVDNAFWAAGTELVTVTTTDNTVNSAQDLKGKLNFGLNTLGGAPTALEPPVTPLHPSHTLSV